MEVGQPRVSWAAPRRTRQYSFRSGGGGGGGLAGRDRMRVQPAPHQTEDSFSALAVKVRSQESHWMVQTELGRFLGHQNDHQMADTVAGECTALM